MRLLLNIVQSLWCFVLPSLRHYDDDLFAFEYLYELALMQHVEMDNFDIVFILKLQYFYVWVLSFIK